jgi:hypothetical protein
MKQQLTASFNDFAVSVTQTPMSLWPAVIRLDATPSDESGMHGKEKVYGSIP